MSSDDIRAAKRMVVNLRNLGVARGSEMTGELAQLLVANAYSQNGKYEDVIKMCLETSDEKVSSVPLNRAIRLFLDARDQIQRPFESRAMCLQSCILDFLLCSVSFWGQVFEYYETMYYKPVELSTGEMETSPATVPFEAGWGITCCFIRDTMLSSTARSAGLSGGYDRSLSWYFYPGNSTSEIDEAKALVLTVIGKIRKRGTVLVSKEGILGHISFSNSLALTHWVDEHLDKDWSNISSLTTLSNEYFERHSIRLNVTVSPVQSDSADINASFLDEENSLLDALDEMVNTIDSSITSRSISLNVRPLNPMLLGSTTCEWNGIDMLEFCREVAEKCVWPEVVNTVLSEGRIGISVINMEGQVVVKQRRPSRRSSVSSLPPELSFSPLALLPFTAESTPTNSAPPPLELLHQNLSSKKTPVAPSPGFGYVHIPQMTPTPQKELPKTPAFKRARDSEVTFCGSPVGGSPNVLVSLPSDLDFEKRGTIEQPPPVAPAVSSHVSDRRRSSVGGTPPASVPLNTVAELIGKCIPLGVKFHSPKEWSIERVLGDAIVKAGTKSLVHLHRLVKQAESATGGGTKNDAADGAPTKKRNSGGRMKMSEKSTLLCDLDESSLLKPTDNLIKPMVEGVFRRSLRSLAGVNSAEKNLVYVLSRILVLAELLSKNSEISSTKLKCMVATAADFVCYSSGGQAAVSPTDLHASGLRSFYAGVQVAMFEVAKDLGMLDWLELSLYYNDEAFVVLMDGNSGLLIPTDMTMPSPKKNAAPSKLLRLSLYEKLPQHCVLVCTELMMRWAWAPTSRVWDTYKKLVIDYQNRRHNIVITESDSTTEADIAELNHFMKQCLINAGTYLLDLADRLGVTSLGVIHAAFDIVRSVILLRPTMLRGRHMYQVVHCALYGASGVLGGRNAHLVDFGRIAQAAVVMAGTTNPDMADLVGEFILEKIPFSSADGAVLFSDFSGPTVFPNDTGEPQPEYLQTGDTADFYEKIFAYEMHQVLYNISKLTHRRSPDRPKGDMGPFVAEFHMHESLSPCAFVAICSATAPALQISLGLSDTQHRDVSYRNFANAFPLVSPLGVLPCLLPPIAPAKGQRMFRWFSDTALSADQTGVYVAVPI